MKTPAEYLVVIERAGDGRFSACVPDLPGCVTCGDTSDEVESPIREAISLHPDSLERHGEPVPPPAARPYLVLV